MPLQKESLKCIPVLPIKYQIEQIAIDIELGNTDKKRRLESISMQIKCPRKMPE